MDMNVKIGFTATNSFEDLKLEDKLLKKKTVLFMLLVGHARGVSITFNVTCLFYRSNWNRKCKPILIGLTWNTFKAQTFKKPGPPCHKDVFNYVTIKFKPML